jgi:hypothetical protein
MIILTADEADQVRGISIKGHALAPAPLVDGTFAIPEECSDDPAHATHHALLASFPTREVATEEYLVAKVSDGTLTDVERDLLEASEFKPDWSIGETITVAVAA